MSRSQWIVRAVLGLAVVLVFGGLGAFALGYLPWQVPTQTPESVQAVDTPPASDSLTPPPEPSKPASASVVAPATPTPVPPTATASSYPTYTPQSVPTAPPTATSSPTPRPAPAVVPRAVIRDVLYGDPGNGERNLLDIYLPSNLSGEIPVVIWLHGGGFSTGSKQWAAAGMPLVEAGYALVGANYRLTSEGDYLPLQIYDTKAVVRWTRANASKYNLDPNRIGVIGHSAGAILAATLGTSGDVAELEGTVGTNLGYSSRIQAAVPMAGIYDLLSYFGGVIGRYEQNPNLTCEQTHIRWFVECCLADGSGECLERLRLGSAINFVSPDDPPFMVMIGDQDQLPHGIEDHKAFHNALSRQGVTSTLVIVPGGGHLDVFSMRTQEVIDFFDEHLKP